MHKSETGGGGGIFAILKEEIKMCICKISEFADIILHLC